MTQPTAIDKHGRKGATLGVSAARDLGPGDVIFVFNDFVAITAIYLRDDVLELDGDNVDGMETGRRLATSPDTALMRYAVTRS